MNILQIASKNLEVQFFLGVILVAVTFLPFLNNLEGLLQDFVPEKAHRMMAVIFGTLYYAAMATALGSAIYLYFSLQHATATM